MKLNKESSSNTDSIYNLDFANYREDSAFLNKHLYKVSEHKLLITKLRGPVFFVRVLLVSVLNSLYYCLILSMDEEIELVTAKIFQSIIILILTMCEYFLLSAGSNFIVKTHEVEGYNAFSEKKYFGDGEQVVEISLNKTEDIDVKETYFYNVIYGMLLFTSELLLYYFLSLSSTLGVNIGSMYSLTVIEHLILLARLPYFHVSFGVFQYLGLMAIVSILVIFYNMFIAGSNLILIVFTGITISLIKFIKYCIFEYVHDKTNNAGKLIRESSYVDGLIGLTLLFFIIMSKKADLLIHDLTIFTKVLLASFLYYFALKLTLYKEKHYYLFVICSSLNFIFITIFDYLLNSRNYTLTQISLTSFLSICSILSFIHWPAIKKKLEQEKLVSKGEE